MNMVIKYKYLFLLFVVIYINSIGAMMIHNKDINRLLRSGKDIYYKNLTNSNIAFRIKNNNVMIGALDSDDVQDVAKGLAEINNIEILLSGIQSKQTTISTNSYSLEDDYVGADEELIINAKQNLFIKDSMLQAKKINMSAETLEYKLCVVHANELVIEVRSATASYATIKLSRKKRSRNPMILEGKINFTNDIANGAVIVFGAQDITVSFSYDVSK